MFDKEAFLNSTYDSGSTKTLLVPEGEYLFQMSDKSPEEWIRTGEFEDKKTGEKKTWARFEPMCKCLDPQVAAKFGRDDVYVPFDGGFLDFDAQGRLDMGEGKNVKLNQLRDANRQNNAGWQLPQLQGAGPFKGVIRHQTGDDGVSRHRITRVTKA